MKKFILAGASTLAILAFANAANAQALDVNVELGDTLSGLFETGDIGGVYVNAAVNAAAVDGSVNIDAVSLVDGLNASRLDVSVEDSSAAAIALGDIDADLDLGEGVPGLNIGVGGVALAAADAGQLGINVIGNRISSTGVLATTAIGAVNDGTLALGALSTRSYDRDFTDDSVGGSVEFDTAAANSASNTSNTAASAAAATASLLIEGATTDVSDLITDNTSTGPVAVIAANVAANISGVDGSVNLGGATINDIAGSATTAIGAVNTGTISNGLPGSITIVAGQTTSTTNTNTNTTTGSGAD